jgi:3-oxoacyl-[acyl-carrier protein] reductase
MDSGLAGARVLVTGASGGIGAATARAFAAEGARVAVHYHRGHERAAVVAAELPDAVLVQADLTSEEETDRLFAEVRRELGGVDVCAAVAGVWPSEDVPVWELGLDRWRATLDANLTATFLTARGFLREVEQNGGGSLVLVGSTAGLFGEAGHADYAAAKSAIVRGLLLSLKNEVVRVAPRARVNAVCPGWTESPMTRDTLDDPSVVERATRTMALRKVATPEDVARQIVVLASDELSGHVTGQVVTVAGGMEGRLLHP